MKTLRNRADKPDRGQNCRLWDGSYILTMSEGFHDSEKILWNLTANKEK